MDDDKEVQYLSEQMFDLCEYYSADVALRATMSMFVVVMGLVIETPEDLAAVIEDMDENIFPTMKKAIVQRANDEFISDKKDLH